MVFENKLCTYCTLCCRNTEMILFKDDIQRLASIGYNENQFVEVRGKFYRLKNVNGKCVFLGDDGRCKVYQCKPLGCSVYPLIFSERVGPILDPECPLSRSDLIKCSEIVKGLNLLKKLMNLIEEEYAIKIDWRIFNRGARKLIDNFCQNNSIKYSL